MPHPSSHTGGKGRNISPDEMGLTERDREMMGNPHTNPEGNETGLVERVKERLAMLKASVEKVATKKGRQIARVEKALDSFTVMFFMGTVVNKDSSEYIQFRGEVMEEIEKLRQIEREQGATDDSELIKEALDILGLAERE